jgi:cell wall-associated NlpC family hydrolase
MRRVAVTTALAALGCLLAGPADAAQPIGGSAPAVPVPAPAPALAPNWAATQIAAVVAAGLLGTDATSFRPDDPLTRGELYEALTALGKTASQPATPGRVVTMRELDAQVVGALGLLPSAKRFRAAARDAGLTPTGMLGTETVARLLGLRVNHPQGQDDLERSPNEPATRAEAAYSFARVLQLGPDTIAYVDQLSQGFALPELGDWQRTVLARALRFVGYPYVWTGVSEKRQQLWSSTAPGGLVTAPGGFDCSGFVWRVYKLQPFAGAPSLGEILKGRTTYSMSAEVRKNARISIDALQPGDLVFFGSRGVRSKPAEIGHMGIYVGNGWMVHSSSNGTTLAPMQGWYATTFAWGRRPLAEAGLIA